MKKMLKMSVNRRSCLKQFLPLFSAKLDTDFSLYKITAKTKDRFNSSEIMLEVPIINSLREIPS